MSMNSPRWHRALQRMAVFALMLVVGTVVADRITVNEGTNFAVAISPNGHHLAMDLQGVIRLLPAQGGKAKDLTGWLDDARLPQWSPDGHEILYQSYRDGHWHIWVIDIEGGAPRQLTSGSYDNREPSWGPDGQSIIFASDRSGNYDIWQMQLASKQLSQITHDATEDFSPTINASGQIAYIAKQAGWGGQSQIKVLTAKGVNTLYQSTEHIVGLSWRRDSKALGVVEFDDEWSASRVVLQQVNVNTGQLKRLSADDADVFPFRPSWGEGGAVYFAADGNIIRRDQRNASGQVIPFTATLPIESRTFKRKAYNFFEHKARPVKGLFHPTVAADGKSIAFTALGDIWLRSADGSLEALTNDAYLDIDPMLSVDGRLMVFASDRTGSMNIWQRQLATGEEMQLTHFDSDQSMPVLSPNGQYLTYTRHDRQNIAGTQDVELLNLATGERQVLLAGNFGPGRVSWSPNSRYLALATVYKSSKLYREGASRIAIIDIKTGDTKFIQPLPNVSLDLRGYNGPVWSPDGKYLAYSQAGALWILPVDASGTVTGEPRRVNAELSAHPNWAGDSRSLIYIATDQLKRLNIHNGRTEVLPIGLTWSYHIPKSQLLIKAGRVFDGEQKVYRNNVDILVDGNRIVDIVPRGRRAFRGRVIDATDKTIIPGLIDSHTHQSAVTGERLGRMWLAYGVTSVRSPGSMIYEALERKESWAAGKRLGPRLFYTGGMLDGSRVYYPMSSSVTSSAMIEQEIERAVKLDYDLIKTYVRLPNGVQKRVVDLAHQHGLPVASHELYPAAGFGVDAKEHLKGTARNRFGSALSLRNRAYDDVVAILAASGMSETPTLALLAGVALIMREHPELLQTPVYKALYTKRERQQFTEGFLQQYFASKSSEFLSGVIARVQADLRRKVDSGVRITAGTDSPFLPYGLSLHNEFHLYVGKGGLSPYEALMSATAWAADALNIGDQIGRLKPGMVADMVIIDGDPLTTIADTLQIEAVISNGRYFKVAQLTKVSL